MRIATARLVCSVALLQACTVKDYTLLDITSITVSPSNPAIPIGGTLQLTASGSLADGSSHDLTSAVTWSSSNPGVATVDASGMASGQAVGSCTIEARSGTVAGTTDLTVRSLAGLASIVIGPSPLPSLPIGLTLQLTATGIYSDGSTVDLTRSATWSSSNTAVASIDIFGLATGRAVGTTTIRAASGDVSGTAELRVVSLVSIAVLPVNPSIRLGSSQQFTARGTFSDQSTGDLTALVTWSSTNAAVASITTGAPTPGLATGRAAGTTTIRAAAGTVNGSTNLTVLAPTSIVVTPSNSSIRVGDSQQFTATGTFGGLPSLDITQFVSWSVNPPTTPPIATITAGGLATGQATGATTVRATSPGTPSTFGETGLTVRGPTQIVVGPGNPSIASGNAQQFTATGIFADGSSRDVTAAVDWMSSNPTVATINPSGVARGLTPGGTTIQATSRGIPSVSGATGLTVDLLSIALSPLTASIRVGQTQQFTATGTFRSGGPQPVTAFVAWSSSNQTVATIDASGLATGRAAGSTGIGARSGSIVQTQAAALTVTP